MLGKNSFYLLSLIYRKSTKPTKVQLTYYTYFIESAVERLINPSSGIYSIIVGNKWMRANFGKPLRKWMQQKHIKEIINFGDLPVFKNVAAYPCIITITNEKPSDTFLATEPNTLDFGNLNDYVSDNQFIVSQKSLNDDAWALVNTNVSGLIIKLKNTNTTLKLYTNNNVNYGIKTGYNNAFIIDEQTKTELISKHPSSSNIIRPFLAGKEVKKYSSPPPKKYLILFETGITNKNKGSLDGETWLSKTYPPVYEYLKEFEEKAKKRSDQGEYWWELRPCKYYDEFSVPKIMYQTFQVKPAFSYDTNGTYCNNAVWIIPNASIALCSLLNSNLGWFLISKICSQIQNGYQLIFNYFGEFPIPKKLGTSKELEIHGAKRIEFTNKISSKSNRFLKRLNLVSFL